MCSIADVRPFQCPSHTEAATQAMNTMSSTTVLFSDDWGLHLNPPEGRNNCFTSVASPTETNTHGRKGRGEESLSHRTFQEARTPLMKAMVWHKSGSHSSSEPA